MTVNQLAYKIRRFSAASFLSSTRVRKTSLPTSLSSTHPFLRQEILTQLSYLINILAESSLAVTASITSEGVTTVVIEPSRPPLEEILSDVVRPVSALFKFANEGGLPSKRLLEWVTARSLPKLKARSEKTERDWDVDLVVLLKGWQPFADDSFDDSKIDILTEYTDVLARYSVVPISDTTDVRVTRENAPQWIGAIATMVDIIRTQACMQRSDVDLGVLQSNLSLLTLFLRIDIIKRVLVHISLGKHLELKPQCDLQPEDDELPSKSDGGGEYVFRYLETLTSWATATSYMFKKKVVKFFANAQSTAMQVFEGPRGSDLQEKTAHGTLVDEIVRRCDPDTFHLQKIERWIAAQGIEHNALVRWALSDPC